MYVFDFSYIFTSSSQLGNALVTAVGDPESLHHASNVIVAPSYKTWTKEEVDSWLEKNEIKM